MLSVEHLSKAYPSGFLLNDVSFSLEPGYILGFIGANGAGKTTALKSLLHLVHPDAGRVTVLGEDFYTHETECKQRIGFTFGALEYYRHARIQKVTAVYKRFYSAWNEGLYRDYLKRFHIDERKRIGELSTGMRVKLGITYALSHGAELLIFDEPTSGLDPVARDELLDLFREIVSGGDRSILFSTHITEDLDKCADYILFLVGGKVAAFDTKDDLICRHALVRGTLAQYEEIKRELIGSKRNAFGFNGLMLRSRLSEVPHDGLTVESPSLQDIMVYYNREEVV